MKRRTASTRVVVEDVDFATLALSAIFLLNDRCVDVPALMVRRHHVSGS
jgi:hypothetical protein